MYSFFYYIIRFVGVSAVTLLVCLINVPNLHVVSIAKLYVIKNLNLNLNLEVEFPKRSKIFSYTMYLVY